MLAKRTQLHVVPQQSTQNTTSYGSQTYKKNQWTFLWYQTGVNFSSRNNFDNFGSFAKVSCIIYKFKRYAQILDTLLLLFIHLYKAFYWFTSTKPVIGSPPHSLLMVHLYRACIGFSLQSLPLVYLDCSLRFQLMSI